MERSGNQERRHSSLRMVVKVYFFTIILGICWRLFNFLLQTVNVLLVRVLQISDKLKNLLRDDNETEEVSPQNSIVGEDFEDDYSNLMDANYMTDTNSREMNDHINSVSFERNGADDIRKEDIEGAETKDIGVKIIPTLVVDFKENSVNLSYPHNMTDTHSPKINDGTTNSAFSKRNVADVSEKYPNDTDTEKSRPENVSIVREDFKDSAKFIDAHNVTDTNPTEMDDSTTNFAPSKSIGADTIPEEDPEDIESEDIGPKNSLIVVTDFKDDSVNLIDHCNVIDTNPTEKKDYNISDSTEKNVAAVSVKEPEIIAAENSHTAGKDLKEDFVNLIDIHNTTDTSTPKIKDSTRHSAFSEKSVFVGGEKDPKDLKTEASGLKKFFIVETDFTLDSANLRDSYNVIDTNSPEINNGTTNPGTSGKNIADTPQKDPKNVETKKCSPENFSVVEEFDKLIGAHNVTDPTEMEDDTTNSTSSKSNEADDIPDKKLEDAATEDIGLAKSSVVKDDFKEASDNLIDSTVTNTNFPEMSNDTSSSSSESNGADDILEKDPEDVEREESGLKHSPIVGEDLKEDSANLRDSRHHVTNANPPEMKDDIAKSPSSESNEASDISVEDLEKVATEDIGLEKSHIEEDFKEDSVNLRDTYVTDTKSPEMSDDNISSSSSESNGTDYIPDKDPENVETDDIGDIENSIIGPDLKNDSANLRDSHIVTATNGPEINDGTTNSVSSEINVADDPQKDLKDIETEKSKPENFSVVGDNFKGSAKFIYAHNATDPTEMDDDTTNSTSSKSNIADDIPEKELEDAATEDISLAKSSVVKDDFKEASANLMDSTVANTNFPEMSNDTTSSSSESNGADDILEKDPEDVETEEIGLKTSIVGEDLEDSSNMRDGHHVRDAYPLEMNDDTASCPSSESNRADDISVEDPENAATEDIGLEKSPVVEGDFKENSANLIDIRVTHTNSSEMSNDNNSSSSSESNGTDYISEKIPENVETDDIGHKNYLIGPDLKDDSANLRDSHTVKITNSPEINDGTTNSVPSEMNVAGAPQKDLKDIEIEKSKAENFPVVGDNFIDSAKFIYAHNVTDPTEMDDDTTNSTSSKSNGADDITEKDPESAATEDICLAKSPTVEDDFNEDSANLIDTHMTDTNSPEMSDDTTSSSSENNGADDIIEKDPEDVETEEIGLKHSPIVREDVKEDSANLRDSHVTNTNATDMNDDIASSSSESNGASDIPEENPEDAATEDICLEKSHIIGEDFEEDSVNLIDAHVTDTNSPEISNDTTSSSSKNNGADDIPEKYLEAVETQDISLKNSSISGEDLKKDSTNLRDSHMKVTNPPEMKDDIASSFSSESNGDADISEADPEDAATEDIGFEKSLIVEDDFKEDSANLIYIHVTDTNSPERSDDTASSSSSESSEADHIPGRDAEAAETQICTQNSFIIAPDFKDDSANLIDYNNVTGINPPENKNYSNSCEKYLSAPPEKNPEDVETEYIGPMNNPTVGEDFKDDSVSLKDVRNMTDTPEMKDCTTISAFSERKVIDVVEKDLKDLEAEESTPEDVHVAEDFKDDSAKCIIAHNVTDTNPTEMNDDISNSTSSERIVAVDVLEEDPEDVEIGDTGPEKSLIVGAHFKDDSANLMDPHNLTDTNPPEINDTNSTSSERIVVSLQEKSPEDIQTEDIDRQNPLTVGEDIKDDSVNLIDVSNMTDNTPEMKNDATNSTFYEINAIDDPEKDPKRLKIEESGSENVHVVGECTKDDPTKCIDSQHATDANPPEKNDCTTNYAPYESTVTDVPEVDSEPEDH